MRVTLFYMTCTDVAPGQAPYLITSSTDYDAVAQHRRLLEAEAVIDPNVCQKPHPIRNASVVLP